MRWQTHNLLGINSLWLLAPPVHQPDPALWMLLVGCAALGALLPDLDASESKIKHLSVAGIKPFALPAMALHGALGHRGLLHSLMGLALVAVGSSALAFYWPWQISVALILGYASHLVVDACTRSGICFRYPDRTRCYLLPPSLRVVTGSMIEEIFLIGLTSLVATLIYTSLADTLP